MTLRFRLITATSAHASGIYSVLEEVSAEIPVLLDSPERVAAIKEHILKCCNFGESWVATTADGLVVGFLIAKPDQLERFHRENEALEITYGGALFKPYREQKIFPQLLAQYTAKGVPLTAEVKDANTSGMADRLVRLRFAKVGRGKELDRLRWQP